MKKTSLLIVFLFINSILFAQVGIGTTSPDTNAILDIDSNSKGILLPRLTDIQRNAIVAPTEGLFIYNLDNHRFEYFNGSVWMAIEATPIATENFFISEYGEGASFDKYIEIYNPNTTVASLDGYKINIYTNGSSTITASFALAGTIAANDVFVFHHISASDATIIAQGNDSSTLNFNGDDVIELEKNGTAIDVIGIIGTDPGSSWTVAGITTATEDNVMQRKNSVTVGNINWTTSAGTNTTNSEWTVLNSLDYSGLGSH